MGTTMGEMVWKEMPAAAVEAGQAVERQHRLPLAPPGKANVMSRRRRMEAPCGVWRSPLWQSHTGKASGHRASRCLPDTRKGVTVIDTEPQESMRTSAVPFKTSEDTAMQDPEVTVTFRDMAQNPEKMSKYQSNPKVMNLIGIIPF
ncbi:hypothetical protein E5288_WYG007714 [Bos mutus]|uniref:Uncharacterized protein n=1 Tax=Bos mutus TaxID=72004 RepID=A0A6B0RGJ6_9CETA|nr:hypothetical protein [Bos mutus]